MDAEAEAREAWQLLLELLTITRARIPAVAANFSLSEPQCQVLRLLSPDEPVHMVALAKRLACDASNITGIVDRLEDRGLLVRRPVPHDRRMKVVALTPRGAKLRVRLIERLSELPEAIGRMAVEDQRALRDILRRVLAEESGAARIGKPQAGSARPPRRPSRAAERATVR
ncbi:MAG: MarR family winged helix-turn-helix transcriptional regulator [Candidatus Binatia bacterium]